MRDLPLVRNRWFLSADGTRRLFIPVVRNPYGQSVVECDIDALTELLVMAGYHETNEQDTNA